MLICLPEMNATMDIHPQIQRQGVLVLEDSAVQRAALVAKLAQLGVGRVHEAADGFAALNLVRNLMVPPALIVIDLVLPDMDGVEVLDRLSEDGYRPAVLIVSNTDRAVITSVGGVAQQLGFYLLGGVSKPVTLEALQHAFAQFDRHLREQAPLEPADLMLSVDELQRALAQRTLRPFYQPKIELRSGRVVSVEALARIRNGDGRIIMPASFIATAEARGMAGMLALCMLDCALTDIQAWQSRGLNLSVALNLSPMLLADKQLINDIISKTDAAGISPRQLTFEITETVLLADVPAALGSISRLRLRGFSISIDDYGTGYSSMQQLSRIPFTEMKIDPTFVRNVPGDPYRTTILRSTFQLARRLGVSTVAEGVETAAELCLLRTLGCAVVQGYYFGQPLMADEVCDWIGQNAAQIADLCAQAGALPMPNRGAGF